MPLLRYCGIAEKAVPLHPRKLQLKNIHRRTTAREIIEDTDGIPTPEVGQLLDKEGIAVRAGHHCAQPALRALGYEMSVRPSFAFYNTKDEIDRLVIAIRKIIASR